MKRSFFICLVVFLCLYSCARDRSHVGIDRSIPSKTIILPEIEKGEIPDSYEVDGQRYYPLPDSYGFVQLGKASWYGKKFHGRLTANGERFNMYQKSAAHKTLPMNTYVKVTNLTNNEHTIVRVNDRGPFIKGRIIDLSYAAAKEIGLIGPGVVEVKVVALGKEVGKLKSGTGLKPLVEFKALKKGEFSVQVGAFQDRDNAIKLATRLKVIFDYVTIVKYLDGDGGTLYRVWVSRSETLTKAGKIEKKLEDMGFTKAFIVRI
jgi:rare lipoprotein A